MAIGKVFSSKRYNIGTDGHDVSPNKATRERIKANGCEPIEGTGEMVDSALLDDTQTYKRKPG
jgi:hypothetical protein